MASIRIGSETHEQLKRIASKQGSKLTQLLREMAALLALAELSPSALQAKLEAASQMHSFQRLLTEQVAKLIKVMAQQERNYLFPFAKSLALLQERIEQLAAREESLFNLEDMSERLQHIEALLQEGKEKLDKQYQLLMEV